MAFDIQALLARLMGQGGQQPTNMLVNPSQGQEPSTLMRLLIGAAADPGFNAKDQFGIVTGPQIRDGSGDIVSGQPAQLPPQHASAADPQSHDASPLQHPISIAPPQAVPSLSPVNVAPAPVAEAPRIDPWEGLREVTPRPNVDTMPTAAVPGGPQAAPAPAGGGLMDKFKAFQGSDMSGRLNDMFTGWAMGSTPQDSIGKGAFMTAQGNQGRKDKASQNQTVEWLKSQGMDEGQAKLVASSPTTLSEFLKERMGGTKPIEINGQLVDPKTHEVIGDYRTPDKDANKPQVVSKGGMIYENGEWKTPPQGAGGSAVDFGDIAGVRKEVQSLPSYKNLAQAAPIWESMVNTSKNDSKASDLNLVYGLGKIFDPNSVVREGEMVMVKDSAGLSDQVIGWINAVNGGARLTPEVRQAIMKEAQNRVGAYSTMYQGDTKQYEGIADRNGIKREDVLPPMPKIQDLPELGAPAPAAGGAQEGATATNPQTGAKIIFRNGNWVAQ